MSFGAFRDCLPFGLWVEDRSGQDDVAFIDTEAGAVGLAAIHLAVGLIPSVAHGKPAHTGFFIG